jgi:beta-barrel assembly-enhancing protease
VLGTQVLYDSGYDPRALAQFFEKLETESKGKNPPEFLSDHPNPEHRVDRVMEEIDKLGGPPANGKRDSQEFEAVKRELLAMPAPPKRPANGAAAGPVPGPSGKFTEHRSASYSLSYPDNWQKYPDREGEGISLAPQGGVVQGRDSAGLAYGLIVGVVQAPSSGNDSGASDALNQGTEQLIQQLRKSNPNMQVARQSGRVHLNNQPGLSTYLSNLSPAGGKETDWLVTVLRPQGMVYFVCVAPAAAFNSYEKTCSAIFDTVRFTG